MLDDGSVPSTRAHTVSAVEAWRRVGRSSAECCCKLSTDQGAELGRNARPPPTTSLCPQRAGAGVTENIEFLRTSHSSLTRQKMVPSSSADLMSAALGPHVGTGFRRGEPRKIPGQGSTSTAWKSPVASSPPPVSLHRQVQVNQSSSPQPLCLIYCSCQFRSTQCSSCTSYC